VRAQDTVARLSGDEFVVVLELLSGADDAVPVAKAIAHQFSRPFRLDEREVVITASIGIALSDAGQETADSLLRNADLAMYRAKSDGRARYVLFDPSMHADTLARLDLENDLRRALDQGELRVHYQPIVAMGTGKFSEVLGQRCVDGKSNEITAVPELLDQLALENSIVTLDAMGGAGQEGSVGEADGRPAEGARPRLRRRSWHAGATTF